MGAGRSDWVTVVPWGIALLGLISTHLFSEARERRKETRAQLDRILQRLTALEERGRKFHSETAYDQAAAREIVAEVARTERAVCRLLPVDSMMTEAIIAHRQSLTLRNFDAGTFARQTADSDVLAEIEATTIDYEETLETVYRTLYPSRFPFFRVMSMDHELASLVVATAVGALLGGVWVFLATR